jgi:hypothetical protein
MYVFIYICSGLLFNLQKEGNPGSVAAFCQMLFAALIEMIKRWSCGFYLILLKYYIDQFAYVESPLYFRDKSHLVMVDIFSVWLNLVH